MNYHRCDHSHFKAPFQGAKSGGTPAWGGAVVRRKAPQMSQETPKKADIDAAICDFKFLNLKISEKLVLRAEVSVESVSSVF